MIQAPHWLKAFKAAQARGFFNEDDKTLAGEWGSCAVGEGAAAHNLLNIWGNNTSDLVHENPALERLGMQFYEVVKYSFEEKKDGEQIAEAKTLRRRINKILAKMEAKANPVEAQ